MRFLSYIILLCWGIFLFYWVINWKSVKPTKEVVFKQRNFQWVLLWIVILIIVLRFFIPSIEINIFKPVSTPLLILQLLGIDLTITGLIIAITARKKLADNWSADVELKIDHKLITTGIYKYVRHPIYTGITVMGIGTILTLQSMYTVIFYATMSGFFIYKLKKEETLMLKKFPRDYPEYMNNTKALIPFIY